MANQEFQQILEAGWPGLSTDEYLAIQRFRECVVNENARQNLTKLLEPKDFFEGHVLDVRALLNCPWVDFPAMDLGSGGGVPGLLAAVLSDRPWVLAESEGHKADFLRRTVQELGIDARVQVVSQRAEDFLKALPREKSIQSIVARAVGPVERIYSWIRPCSTWNNLVLLKGPGWSEEWNRFETGRYRGELAITETYSYEVGDEKKQRIIVKLARVPRGTRKKG